MECKSRCDANTFTTKEQILSTFNFIYNEHTHIDLHINKRNKAMKNLKLLHILFRTVP